MRDSSNRAASAGLAQRGFGKPPGAGEIAAHDRRDRESVPEFQRTDLVSEAFVELETGAKVRLCLGAPAGHLDAASEVSERRRPQFRARVGCALEQRADPIGPFRWPDREPELQKR